VKLGGDDVHSGRQLAGGLRCGLHVRLVEVTGAGRRPVGAPAVALDVLPGSIAAPAALVGILAPASSITRRCPSGAALGRLLGRHRDQRLALRGASALAAAALAAAEQRLVELDHAAQQQLVLAAARGVRALAAQQPDRQQPLAQVGARLVEQRARGQRNPSRQRCSKSARRQASCVAYIAMKPSSVSG